MKKFCLKEIKIREIKTETALASKMSLSLKIVLAALVFVTAVFHHEPAWARKHKKFKGVIIVNQILKLDGTITNNGNPAAEYSGIHQGDVLETGDKSLAVVRIPGLAVFRLGANTKVKFTKFNDRNASQIDLLKGELFSLYRRTGEHELMLNHAAIKLHGTTLFTVSSPEKPNDEICLCDGKIQVTALTPEPAANTDSGEPQGHKKRKHKKVDDAAVAAANGAVGPEADTAGPSKDKLNAIAASKGASISAAPTSTAAAGASPSASAPPIFKNVSDAVNQTDAAKNGKSESAATGATPATVTGSTATPPAASAAGSSSGAAPSAAAPLEMQIQISSEMAHKQCEVSQKGVEMKPNNTLMGLHSDREIKELESLYALP